MTGPAESRLAALRRVAARLAAARDDREVLQAAASSVPELTGTRACAVVAFDPESRAPTLACTWGLTAPAQQRLHAFVEQAGRGEACLRCHSLTARLEQDCPLLAPLQQGGCRPEAEAVVCLPVDVQGARQAVIGAYLEPGQHLAPEALQALLLLAAQLGPALRAAQLQARLQGSRVAGARARAARDVGHGGTAARWLRAALALVAEACSAPAAVLRWEVRPGTWRTVAYRRPGVGAGAARQLRQAAAAKDSAIGRIPRPAGGPLERVAVVPVPTGPSRKAWLALGWDGQATAGAALWMDLDTLGRHLGLLLRLARVAGRAGETARAQERLRLSRELHDGLAQTLAFLKLQAERTARLADGGPAGQAPAELARWAQLVGEAYEQVRQAIDGLRASARLHESLDQALAALSRQLGHRWGVGVAFRVRREGADTLPGRGRPIRVDGDTQLELLRIAHEAITNACKHGRPGHVEVELAEGPDGLELVVQDDGPGFDVQTARARGGVGLCTMAERAAALGATLSIHSAPGSGTCVRVRVPASRRLRGRGGGR